MTCKIYGIQNSSIKKVLLEHSHTHLHTVYGCFYVKKLNTCGDHRSLPFIGEVCQPLV